MILSKFYKLQALGDISRDIGQIFFASWFVAFFYLSPTPDVVLSISGLILAVVFWGLSILAAKE